MAYPPSCKHAYIHVSPLQTLLMISVVILLASMLSVAAAVAPPGGYHFRLTHVDAHGNFTEEELISRAAHRSRLRRADSTPSDGASPATIRPLLHYSPNPVNEYLMEIVVEEKKKHHPTQRYQAIVDTGSSLIWLKPHSKQKMCSHSDRLPCKDHLCASFTPPKCHSDKCWLDTKYADRLHVSGPVCRETLCFRLNSNSKHNCSRDIAIGWSESEHRACPTIPNKNPAVRCGLKKEDGKYDGIVGLGLGKGSLVKQLNVSSFSYCLTTYKNINLTSELLLGAPDALKDKDSCANPTPGNKDCVQTTPLLNNSFHPSAYYVHLKEIKIGGETIYRADEDATGSSKPKEKDATGSSEAPNMFIDSGVSFTILEEKAYEKLREHVNKTMMTKEAKPIRHTFCWPGTEKDIPTGLNMELHFANGAVMYLPKDKVMYPFVDEDGHEQVCLAIEAGGKVSVLGNFQQQNIHMRFDVDKELSFLQEVDCSKVSTEEL